MDVSITTLIDFETYPLDQPDAPAWQALARCVATITPRMVSASAEIRRDHTIYFLDKVDGLPDDHPAMQKSLPFTTPYAPTNCVICPWPRCMNGRRSGRSGSRV